MVSPKMQATANAKGFTLVELIVVITILAILGTIGFISLQGYSAQSRDSKRTSDLRSLATAVTTKNTEGLGLLSMVTTLTTATVASAPLSGKVAGATEYTAGSPNATTLGINAGNFKDPSADVDYRIGATTLIGGAFQLAATLENGGGTKSALVTGSYNARTGLTGAWKAISTAAATGGTSVVLTDAGVGFFKKGDNVSFTSGPTGSYVLSNVSSDGKTLTLATATAGAPITLTTTVWLTTTETPGLIAGSTTASANSVVNAGTTNLPY